jgi:hypothetical protein
MDANFLEAPKIEFTLNSSGSISFLGANQIVVFTRRQMSSRAESKGEAKKTIRALEPGEDNAPFAQVTLLLRSG